MLIQLTYASRATSLLRPGDVKDILSRSQRNNAAQGITGALCLANGIFLQQLEGDRQAVNQIYHRILRDARHSEPAILNFGEIAVRRFSNWSMGLLSATPDNQALLCAIRRAPSSTPSA